MKLVLYKSDKGHYYLVDNSKTAYEPGFMVGSSFERMYKDDGIHKLSIENCQAIEKEYENYLSWDMEVRIVNKMMLVGQCNCPCHQNSGIIHVMACCHPKMIESPQLDSDGCIILAKI